MSEGIFSSISPGYIMVMVIAYHILHTICIRLRSQGISDGWATVRKGLSNHVRITTTMKRDDGRIIYVRKTARPEMNHKKIYDTLLPPLRSGTQ